LSYSFTSADIAFDSQDCFLTGPFQQTNTDNATVVQVTFSKVNADGSTTSLSGILRAGITATGSDGVKRDRTQTIQAVVNPATETGNISISGVTVQGGGQATVSVKNTNTSAGTITITVSGTTRSANAGDFSVIAKHNPTGAQFAQQVSIVVPAQIATPHPQPSGVADPGVNRVLSVSTSPVCFGAGSNVCLVTDYTTPLTITVWDQFGSTIGDLYAGATISETIGKDSSPINQALTSSSTYTDPFGLLEQPNTPSRLWRSPAERPKSCPLAEPAKAPIGSPDKQRANNNLCTS
jgi:hypothetical protein